MSQSPVFSFEIYELIVSYVPVKDRDTLLTLSISSPALAFLAQARLFMVFRTDWLNHHSATQRASNSAKPPTRSTVQFLRSIIINPHLALHVHEFVTPLLSSVDVSSAMAQEEAESWLSLLPCALPLMKNLKSLSLFFDSCDTSPIRSNLGANGEAAMNPHTKTLSVLSECSFQLQELRYASPRDQGRGGTQSLRLLHSFLASHSSFNALSLRCPPLPHSLPPYALPDLTTLSSTPSNISLILPGCQNITTLQCVNLNIYDGFNHSCTRAGCFQDGRTECPLGKGLGRIKRFSSSLYPFWLRDRMNCFSSLEVLQTNIGAIQDYRLLPGYFPSLRVLHLAQGGTRTSEAGMVSKWLFSQLPHMESIIWGPSILSSPLPPTTVGILGRDCMKGGSEYVAEESYDCWTRKGQPSRVTAREVHEMTGLLLVDKLCP